MLTISPDIRQKLKTRLLVEEGYKQFPYTDSTGHLTIVIGRNLEKVGISLDEALYMLDDDLMSVERNLWHYCAFYSALSEIRKSVLVDIAFNMGIRTVLDFKEMISCIEKQDYEGAAKAMMNSEWAKQVGNRASKLALIMETGEL